MEGKTGTEREFLWEVSCQNYSCLRIPTEILTTRVRSLHLQKQPSPPLAFQFYSKFTVRCLAVGIRFVLGKDR